MALSARLQPPEQRRALRESLAERLRSAARGLDNKEISERLAGLRQGREAEQAQRAQERARDKTREQAQERKTRARDDGWDHEF